MILVSAFIHPTRIVKQREQRHDILVSGSSLSNPHTVLEDTRPVNDTMISPLRKCVSRKDYLHQPMPVVKDYHSYEPLRADTLEIGIYGRTGLK